ncbi:GAF domain-containing SpoIIE family protein phosphatase [Candidatus Amarolinea dominans]|uniref:GAF domain-containing SpoIIE family protein phosphatase n=1 Tax=Candidatus Amarolinea dominans TaxID=3140696 RepID=UPI0031CC989E
MGGAAWTTLAGNDVSLESRYFPDDPRLLPDTQAELGVPLMVEDRVLGVLDVQARELNAFTSEDLFILTALADQIAVAIEDTRLYQAAKDEAAISSALLDVANAMARPYRVPEMANTVARLTPSLAGVDRCTVMIWDHEQATYEVLASQCQPSARHVKPVQTGLRVAARDFPLLDQVCRERRPLWVEDVSADDLVPPEIVRRYGMQAILGVPLIVQNEVLGVLLVDEVDAPHIFSSRQVEMVRGVASQLAVAIESARLALQETERARMGEELRVAHEIQASFLPEASPSLPGYDIAHVWLAAREVAGDFFDFIPLTARRLGLVIADVSDKGVPAALFMALARILMRVIAADRRSPARVLRRVNELLLENSRSDMFITLWYGVLDPVQHDLLFANAGHNPPLLLSAATGKIRLLRKHGLILGILPAVALEDDRVALAPGDILILYTDGVTDAINLGEESFEMTRLQDVVLAHQTQSAAAIAEAIKAAVREFVGSAPQFDDLTLIVVKRLI